MRRWLLIFLVVLLPMQLSWAAVVNYCEYESGTTTQHAGHPEHQHAADADSADGDSPTANGSVDADCGACHAGCCTALVQSLNLLMAALPSGAHSAPALHLSSQPASLPERPNWADLA